MKKLVVLLIAAITLSSCTKKEEEPIVLPELTVADVSVNERDEVAVLTFSLNEAPTSEASFVFRAIDGLARAGVDYIAPTQGGKIVFPSGVKSQTLSIRIINDLARRPTRGFQLRLEDSKGITLLKTSAFISITDDDLLPLVEFDKPAQVVPKVSALASVAVSLSVPSPERLDIRYSVSGTGQFGVDHRFASGVLTFPTGTTQATINGDILANQIAGPNKTILLTLETNAAAIIGSQNFHTVIISDTNSNLAAVISGEPTGTSNTRNLDVTVSGVNVTRYRYKISTTYTCDIESGYSTARSISQKIQEAIGSLPDGLIYLCVIGGNEDGFFQSAGSATAVSWTKNTNPPQAPNFRSMVSSFKPLGTGQVLSNQARVIISVGNLKPGHRVVLYDSPTCEVTKEIGRTPVNDTTANVEGVYSTDGTHVLYAVAMDQFDQGSPCSQMLSLYQLDTQVPRVIDVSTLQPSGFYGVNSTVTLKVKFSETIEVQGPANQTPYLTLSTQPAIASATYVSIAGDTMTFTYSPKVTENSSTFDYYSQTSLVPSASTIKDLAGNNANLVLPLPGSLASISGKVSIRIDTESPENVSGVSDGSWGPLNSTPRISWVQAIDVGGSGVKWYEVAIGSTPGGRDLIDWTPTTATSIEIPFNFVAGRTYYASVRVRDNANNLSAVTQANGWGIDPNPPSNFNVSISATQTYDNFVSPRIEWTEASDPGSGIDRYEIALGTTAGATDVINWQKLSNTTLFHIFNYNGQYNQRYYPTVRAVDAAGNITTVGHSGWLNVRPVTTPDPAPAFTAITLVKPDTLQISNEVTIQGIQTDVLVAISASENGRLPVFSINGASYQPSGSVRNGDKIRFQAKSSSSYNTKVSFTIQIGGGTYIWDVTTWGCPQNYSLVKSYSSNIKDFCVAKYEPVVQSNKAVSSPTNIGTVVKSLTDAVTFCSANGPLFDLISNDEYQRLARDIELVGWNWEGGIIGNGILSGGNIDAEKTSTLGAVTPSFDNDPCAGINGLGLCDESNWSRYRRTHKLNSGDYVWDLSGNLQEWVSTPMNYADYNVYNTSAEKCESPPTPYEFDPETGELLPLGPTKPPVCRIQISDLTTINWKSAFGPANNYVGVYFNSCTLPQYNTQDTCVDAGGTWNPGSYSWGGIGSIPKPTVASGTTWVSRGGDYNGSEYASRQATVKLWREGVFSVKFQGTSATVSTGAAPRCVYRMP